MFDKILIANRGEIAVRIIKTARRMGIATVAVYSDADRDGLFVKMADEAVHIGPAPAAKSYLRGEKILAAAERSGAQAIHPGYGFLSENAQFAKLCAKANIEFIGPNIEAMIAMGSKSAAKQMMAEAGVPLAPGYQGDDQSVEHFLEQAKAIGYPILLKASAGGGGKGMRLVRSEDELPEALASAKREAKSAFGDDHFLIEKYIDAPRHVEVQIFGDKHGHLVHLFERDCSVQRRHQKIIEEAPAPNLPDHVRHNLHQAALKAAEAVNYVGAGTVEFLYDGDDAIYFMEMNTRLQVEHPVTEKITGLDLVEWQLLVAAGENLPLTQEQITCTGHAFEARLYAEDPLQDYRPSIGRLHRLCLPQESENIRIDSGVAQGAMITPFYDPMILKLITHGPDRKQALAKMRQALGNCHISGVDMNVPLLAHIAAHEKFMDGQFDTHFIDQYSAALLPPNHATSEDMALASIALILQEEENYEAGNLWQRLGTWRVNQLPERFFFYQSGETILDVHVEFHDSHTQARVGEDIFSITDAHWQGERGSISLGGHALPIVLHRPNPDKIRLWVGGRMVDLAPYDPSHGEIDHKNDQASLSAPMPGTITALIAKPGQEVAQGDVLLVMEAMKMEYAIKAPAGGIVRQYPFSVGDQVAEGAKLVDFEVSPFEVSP